jgi:CheY-like chemotaxis protein
MTVPKVPAAADRAITRRHAGDIRVAAPLRRPENSNRNRERASAVAQNLRSTDVGGGMLLVALTGYGPPEDRARALESGFDLHLVKPEKLHAIRAQAPARRQSSTTQP